MALTILPNPGQSLQVTRDPIRNNFQVIDNAFGIDHAGYNLPDQGKHNKITMPDGADVSAGFAATETGFFNYLFPTTGHNEIYAVSSRIAPDPANIGYPMTAWDSNITADKWWSYLPSGFILKWGRTTVPANSNPLIVTFDGPAWPAGNILAFSCVSVTAPTGGNFYFAQTSSIGGAQFSVRIIKISGAPVNISDEAVNISWWAIGR